MTREETIKLMRDRGFELYATTLGGYIFQTHYDPIRPTIACEVQGDTFQFKHVTDSLLTVQSGELSPIANEAHFQRFYIKIVEYTQRYEK